MEFVMWPDVEERKAAMPLELAAALKGAKAVVRWYDAKLNDAAKYAIAKWMEEAKTAEARRKRGEQMAERLMATMEAEVELPPAIAMALRRVPGAVDGWAAMTDTQRRNELMAVFYYQSVESREKRIGKLVAGAVGKGKREK